MITSLIGNVSKLEIGVLKLDLLVTEEIALEGEVSKYPVEDGTQINDHVFQGAEIVRISGVVSEGSVETFSFSSALGTRIADAIEVLRSMHKERALVTVTTGKMVYNDMAFASMNASRSADGEGGNWLSVKAELVKIRKVTLKTASVPSDNGRTGQTQTPAGRSSPTSTPTAENPAARGRTTAFGIFNWATGR